MKIYLLLIKSAISGFFQKKNLIGSIFLFILMTALAVFYGGLAGALTNETFMVEWQNDPEVNKQGRLFLIWGKFGQAGLFHVLGLFMAITYSIRIIFNPSRNFTQITQNFQPISKLKRYSLQLTTELASFETWLLFPFLIGIYAASIAMQILTDTVSYLKWYQPFEMVSWLVLAYLFRRCVLKLINFELPKENRWKVIAAVFLLVGIAVLGYFFGLPIQWITLVPVLGSLLFLGIDYFLLEPKQLEKKQSTNSTFKHPILQLYLNNKKFKRMGLMSIFMGPLLGLYFKFFTSNKDWGVDNMTYLFLSSTIVFNYWAANIWAIFTSYWFTMNLAASPKRILVEYFKLIMPVVLLQALVAFIAIFSLDIVSHEYLSGFFWYYILGLFLNFSVGVLASVRFAKQTSSKMKMNKVSNQWVSLVIMILNGILLTTIFYPLLRIPAVVIIGIGFLMVLTNFKSFYQKDKYRLFQTIIKG